MFCVKCGSELDVEAAFCHQCGTPVSTKQHEPQPVPRGTKVSPDNAMRPQKDKLKPTIDYNALIQVFFPILTGVISAIGMFLCYGTELDLPTHRFILCIGTILSAVETVLIIIDAKKGRLKKRLILFGIVNLIAVLWVTIWRITSNWYSVTMFEHGTGDLLMLCSIIIVLFVPGIIATNSLVKRQERYLLKRRERFIIVLIVLVAAFSFCTRAAVNHNANATYYAHRIEQEREQEQEQEQEQERKQEREQEKTTSGEIKIEVIEEASLADALEFAFGGSPQSRYEDSKRNATVYSLLSAITGVLIVLDGIVIYRNTKKSR